MHLSFKSHNLIGPTSYAGLILILHAMHSLGLISIIEGIQAEKSKNATYSTLQINLSILAEMILGVENGYWLKEGLENDALLEIFCTLADGKTSSRTTLNRDIRTRYDPEDVKCTFEVLIQWLKVLGLLRVVIVAIDSSKLYVNGKLYENTAKVREQFKTVEDLNDFPCRAFRGIKTNLYFKFIAFVILFVFKKLLTEKYRNAGLTVLRRYIIKQPAVLYYRKGEVLVDMHGKKQKKRGLIRTLLLHMVSLPTKASYFYVRNNR